MSWGSFFKAIFKLGKKRKEKTSGRMTDLDIIFDGFLVLCPLQFHKFWFYICGYIFCVLPQLQTMTTFMPPPPAATVLAFHPQDNNIIAIGMEDSSIQIYNVRVDEVLLCLPEA
jgi:hypothetical protein